MKIYNVIYIHVINGEVYDDAIPFLDYEKASEMYEKKRQLALDVARDDDPDSDEEVFKDLNIAECKHHFRCHVVGKNESFVVRLSVCDAK